MPGEGIRLTARHVGPQDNFPQVCPCGPLWLHCANWIFDVRYAIVRLQGRHHLVEYGVEGVKITNPSFEAMLAELSTASADLAKSATVWASRMVLRSKLSDAIADATKAERAAEVLRAMAADGAIQHEQASLVPAPGRGFLMQRESADS